MHQVGHFVSTEGPPIRSHPAGASVLRWSHRSRWHVPESWESFPTMAGTLADGTLLGSRRRRNSAVIQSTARGFGTSKRAAPRLDGRVGWHPACTPRWKTVMYVRPPSHRQGTRSGAAFPATAPADHDRGRAKDTPRRGNGGYPANGRCLPISYRVPGMPMHRSQDLLENRNDDHARPLCC